jgi:AcrR family transcriptional regulator
VAEIAARADAKIGSLYRFFPNKDARGRGSHESICRGSASGVRRGDTRAGGRRNAARTRRYHLLVKRHPQTRAFAALLDSRADWTEVRQQLRAQTLGDIKTALTICAPDDKDAEDVAAVVLNNMKAMTGMTMNDAPTTPGAPDQLRLMNRLCLAAVLRPGG